MQLRPDKLKAADAKTVAMSSRRGMVIGFVGASRVLLNTRCVDEPDDHIVCRYTAAAYAFPEASQKQRRVCVHSSSVGGPMYLGKQSWAIFFFFFFFFFFILGTKISIT